MKLILFFMLLLPLKAFTQNNSCEFTFIDSVSIEKDNLYKKIRIWVSKIFNDSKDAIQLDDKEMGTIICKGRMAVPGTKNFMGNAVGDDFISFTLSIDIKDSGYRLVYNELTHKAGYYDGAHSGGSLCNDKPANGGSLEFSKKRWQKIKDFAKEKITSLQQELKIALAKTDNF